MPMHCDRRMARKRADVRKVVIFCNVIVVDGFYALNENVHGVTSRRSLASSASRLCPGTCSEQFHEMLQMP